ncbi:MAG: hypothetical protein V4501_05435 [Pseudomonadota bacterium]
MAKKLNIGNLKILLVLLVFIVPMGVAWVMFEYPDYFKFRTTNYGKLMQPMVHDKNFLDATHRGWQIVYAPEDCQTEEAGQQMFFLHQLRLALGKDADRVSLALLTERACPLTDTHDFRKLLMDTAQVRAAVEDHHIENKIFLVDPQGNVFMYYSDKGSAMRILKDLKRVLEVSQIG